ncbi:MAG: hypothetical protein IJJ48_07830 [Firmicutes bacterium]|nr:hypothetical protein [Bacillota bacterium]
MEIVRCFDYTISAAGFIPENKQAWCFLLNAPGCAAFIPEDIIREICCTEKINEDLILKKGIPDLAVLYPQPYCTVLLCSLIIILPIPTDYSVEPSIPQ